MEPARDKKRCVRVRVQLCSCQDPTNASVFTNPKCCEFCVTFQTCGDDWPRALYFPSHEQACSWFSNLAVSPNDWHPQMPTFPHALPVIFRQAGPRDRLPPSGHLAESTLLPESGVGTAITFLVTESLCQTWCCDPFGGAMTAVVHRRRPLDWPLAPLAYRCTRLRDVTNSWTMYRRRRNIRYIAWFLARLALPARPARPATSPRGIVHCHRNHGGNASTYTNHRVARLLGRPKWWQCDDTGSQRPVRQGRPLLDACVDNSLLVCTPPSSYMRKDMSH